MRRDEMRGVFSRGDAEGAEVARAVASSCASADPDALATTLTAHAVDPASYEASVRGGAGRALSAGRMMIERAPVAVLDAVAHALGVRLPSEAGGWVERARDEGVPLIVGWDLRGRTERRCVKLYVNASDAADTVRARLCAALAPEAAVAHAPAVLGMNLCADGRIETKVYVQTADAVDLAAGLAPGARALAAAARGEGADAGGVLSFDIDGHSVRPRAFFVALREPVGITSWRCVESLPGYDARAVEALVPFPAAPARSIGISLSDGAWTVYCKPRQSSRAPEALEPAAVFRAGAVEVGLFVEPNERAPRAFCRTARHAISVREREGVAEPRAIESLVTWFALHVQSAEEGGMPIAARLDDPPAPWRIVARGAS